MCMGELSHCLDSSFGAGVLGEFAEWHGGVLLVENISVSFAIQSGIS